MRGIKVVATAPTNLIMFENLSDVDVLRAVLEQASNNLGLQLDFQEEGELCYFTVPETGDRVTYWNYDFGFNKSLNSMYAKDKVVCYNLLSSRGVSAIEHFLFSQHSYTDVFPLDKSPLPCVLKPNRGGGGKDVFFCNTRNELLPSYIELAKKYDSVCLSPLEVFDNEYRVTVLDNKVLLSYGKTKGENNQNNLSMGAKIVAVPEELQEDIHALAIKANKALGLRLTNVDIVNTKNGLKVLEVNNTVVLKRVAHEPHYFPLCVQAYEEILKLALYELKN